MVSIQKKAMFSASLIASAGTGNDATRIELPREQWPPRSEAAGYAWVFCQCLTEAVDSPVGGVPSLKNHSLVAELWQEVGRLRSISELEKIDWWNHILPSLRQAYWPATTQEMENPLCPCQQAVGGNLRKGGMEAFFCLEWQVNPFCAYLTILGALTKQVWGSGTWWPGKELCRWRSIQVG